jgi:hypothetical protein
VVASSAWPTGLLATNYTLLGLVALVAPAQPYFARLCSTTSTQLACTQPTGSPTGCMGQPYLGARSMQGTGRGTRQTTRRTPWREALTPWRCPLTAPG